ncbi:uncharacterized protein VP01_5076g1 [Puccinia sorghi]|uniref:Uncharacterized protein n=1 Tax=Puccinia sorghi TaxID=27349 RepID=A0A0L6ULE8_9BASI|nr:uncharacterized protein VP01_5076g1 [Puccinia sorghi]
MDPQVIENNTLNENLALCNLETDSLLCVTEALSTFIHSCFNQFQNILCKQFQKIKSKLSLTYHVWTPPSNLSVLDAIALGAKIVEGNHSCVSLATHLAKLINSFKFCENIFCIEANNASNNGTMAAHLATFIPFVPSQWWN